MKNLKLAIIGAGVMGEVILKGIIKKNLFPPENIMVTALSVAKLEKLHNNYNVKIATDNRLASKFADIILLAVKPSDVQNVLEEIVSEELNENCLFISIAAGVSIEKISKIIGEKYPVFRIMTNTPCQVGHGMSAISGNQKVEQEHITTVQNIFNSVGETLFLKEKYLDAVTGLSGSGPGFWFLIAETLIDAGVLQGLPRDVSRKLVLETMIGSAILLKESGKHPAPLKDMVTSPGGTTISGIQVMEEYKVRAALLKVVETATKKSKELGNIG